jgi:hypothetical protein
MGGKIQRRADNNDERSGQLSIVKSVTVKEQMDQRIRDNRKISTDETTSEVIMS